MDSINPVWFHQQEIFDEAARTRVRNTSYSMTKRKTKIKNKEQVK